MHGLPPNKICEWNNIWQSTSWRDEMVTMSRQIEIQNSLVLPQIHRINQTNTRSKLQNWTIKLSYFSPFVLLWRTNLDRFPCNTLKKKAPIAYLDYKHNHKNSLFCVSLQLEWAVYSKLLIQGNTKLASTLRAEKDIQNKNIGYM